MKPANELTQKIKQTDFQNRDFLLNNLKDPSLVDGFMKRNLTQAKKIAIVLGSSMVVALIFVVFAFVQQTTAKAAKREVNRQKAELELCIQNLDKQRALAVESQLIAEEANKMASEQLQDCQKRNR